MNNVAQTHTFSKGEEIANATTHGIGALLSVVALIILVVDASLYGSVWHVVSFTLFGSTMVLLYTASTFVHALPQGKAKNVFEVLDHSSIYFFIAGTYAPYLLLAIKGALGWTIFGIVFGLAIGGTVFKSFFVKKFLVTSTLLYVVMGWMIVFAWHPLVQHIPNSSLVLLVLGGVLYTIGSIFYVWRGFKYHHMAWHLFVLAGTTAHFFSILYLLP
jgi:hemolysin III